MTPTIVLDTGILSKITHPRMHEDVKSWFQGHLRHGSTICVPEIADYELRRELLRSGHGESVIRLDDLERVLVYVPITTAIMLRAAELWARMRNLGLPTAEEASLDGDVILASQAMDVERSDGETVVVTDNVGHLGRMVKAKNRDELRP